MTDLQGQFFITFVIKNLNSICNLYHKSDLIFLCKNNKSISTFWKAWFYRKLCYNFKISLLGLWSICCISRLFSCYFFLQIVWSCPWDRRFKLSEQSCTIISRDKKYYSSNQTTWNLHKLTCTNLWFKWITQTNWKSWCTKWSWKTSLWILSLYFDQSKWIQ